MFSTHILGLYRNKRIALTILFRFNAMMERRLSFVTAGMPRFLILERLCSRFNTEKNPSAHIFRRRTCASRPHCRSVHALYKKQDNNCFQEFCAECPFAESR